MVVIHHILRFGNINNFFNMLNFYIVMLKTLYKVSIYVKSTTWRMKNSNI